MLQLNLQEFGYSRQGGSPFTDLKVGASVVALVSAGLGLVMQDKLHEYWHLVVLASLGTLVAFREYLYLRVRMCLCAYACDCMRWSGGFEGGRGRCRISPQSQTTSSLRNAISLSCRTISAMRGCFRRQRKMTRRKCGSYSRPRLT